MFVKEEWNILELIKNINDSDEKEIFFDWNDYTDESLEKLSNMLSTITSTKPDFKIVVKFNKVRETELAGIKNLDNHNLNIVLDQYTYTLNEFENLNSKLDDLIKDINPNLTPYEKYTQIYEIVRNYKEYKVVDRNSAQDLRELMFNKNQSSNLKYILDGEYMDCHGFSTLLHTLLNKCDIESYEFGLRVNMPNGTTDGHSRVMINLDDDKYDVHGIFISDPTWDSANEIDNLEYSLLPFDSMRDPLFEKCPETLLFDANSQEEFFYNTNELKNILPRYTNLRKEAISIVNRIDRKESSKLKNMNSDEIYVELQKYVLSRSNNQINDIEQTYGGNAR